jgi:hypothetical protein
MQQAGQAPGGPAPNRGPYVQPRPQTSYFTIFLIIGVIAIVILGVGCAFVYSMIKSTSGPNTIRVTANQYYEGDLNRTLLVKVLTNNSYDPSPSSPTNSIISFRPFCGDPGSEEANSTRPLFALGDFFLNGDNTTVKLVTKLKSNSESNRNMLEDSTNCAFDKLAQIMKDDLNMSLSLQKIDMKKFTTPGFETVVVIAAVVVVVAFYRYKKVRGQ